MLGPFVLVSHRNQIVAINANGALAPQWRPPNFRCLKLGLRGVSDFGFACDPPSQPRWN
jgi:hypothetical protein